MNWILKAEDLIKWKEQDVCLVSSVLLSASNFPRHALLSFSVKRRFVC